MNNQKLSAYKAVWLVTMFDLPVTTKKARREYTRFRKLLLKRGFIMLQFSVYARFCSSEDISKVYQRDIANNLPTNGQVRVLLITDKQFGKMRCYYGKNRKPIEQKPAQLCLF